MQLPLLLLSGAIACEVAATLSLRASLGFSRLWPSVAVVVGYVTCFVLLGFALKAGLHLGVGYAIWSGVGTAVVAVASVLLFQERLTQAGVVGVSLIILGVVILNLSGIEQSGQTTDSPADHAAHQGVPQETP